MDMKKRLKRIGTVFLCLCGVMLMNSMIFADNATFTGTVSIVHFNDVHGYANESDSGMGYAKIGGFIEAMKAKNPNTMVLDAGDTFAGSVNASVHSGENIIPILNTLGIDVMTAGNHDFSVGTEQYKKLSGMLNYPVLCGNMVYKESGTSVSDSYHIMTLANGMKVGVVGVTTPDSDIMGSVELKYTDAVLCLEKAVNEVKPQVDLVVGLLHLGDVSDVMSSVKVANEVEGIDVIIDGHSHTVLPTGRIENGITIAQAGEYGEYIGVVDLTYENGEIIDVKARLVGKEEMQDIPEKADTKAAIDLMLNTVDAYSSVIVGETHTELIGTRNIVRTKETNLGSMFADAMLEASNSDVAFLPAGLVGDGPPAGEVTMGDILTMARNDTLIIVKEMTGEDILVYMNYKNIAYPAPSGTFLQIGGGKYKIDPNLTEEKVFDVEINGNAIESDKIYRVALVIGSDAEAGAVNYPILETAGTTAEALRVYIEKYSPVNPVEEGRIVEAEKGFLEEPTITPTVTLGVTPTITSEVTVTLTPEVTPTAEPSAMPTVAVEVKQSLTVTPTVTASDGTKMIPKKESGMITTSPKTGDTNQLIMHVILTGIALSITLIMVYKRKRENR